MTTRLKRGDFKSFKIRTRNIDSEIGKLIASLDVSAFKGIKAKQHLQSYSFQWLCLELIEKLSYRDTADTINRFLHLEGESSLKYTTLEDRVESVGKALSSAYEIKTESILETHGVDKSSGVVSELSMIPAEARIPNMPSVYEEKYVRKLISDYNRGRDSLLKLKYSQQTANIEADTERCCYIRIDDVGVKHQKPSRSEKSDKSRKYVENTVIHIQVGDKQYTITAIGMDKAFKRLLAFLLENRLMEDNRLIFLTDGAVNIRDRINKYFAFREKTIILDWLHLEKKCYEYMSMAVKGTKSEKEEMKKTLTAVLWTGRADKALKFLKNINKKNIKNISKLEELEDYIQRKSPNIPCYALRHELGLTISSNRVEKENDLIVASRQKHNGMAWSDKGSGALSIIKAALHNKELKTWITSQKIQFKMCA